MGQASILRSSSGVKGLPVVFILSGFITVFLSTARPTTRQTVFALLFFVRVAARAPP
jgi:hypothetical protein